MSGDSLSKALELLSDARFDDAHDTARAALEAGRCGREERVRLVILLGEVAWARGKLDVAEPHFRLAIRTADDDLNPKHRVARSARYTLAAFLAAIGRAQEAADVIRSISDARPIDDALRELALAEYDPGARPKAREALTKALKRDDPAIEETLRVLLSLLNSESEQSGS